MIDVVELDGGGRVKVISAASHSDKTLTHINTTHTQHTHDQGIPIESTSLSLMVVGVSKSSAPPSSVCFKSRMINNVCEANANEVK